MDSDSLISALLSASSRRLHSPSADRHHEFLGGRTIIVEDTDVDYDDDDDDDDDFRAAAEEEFMCPFCGHDFDLLSLFCHIDDLHPLQSKNGICPVCSKKVGMDLVGHITTQHRSFLKAHHKRRCRRGGSNSAFSLMRRGTLQSLFGGSSYIAPSNSAPDPLLSSFIHNSVVDDDSLSLMSCPPVEVTPVKDSSKDDLLERKPQELKLSEEDKIEKARRFEFVQGLLSSTILDD